MTPQPADLGHLSKLADFGLARCQATRGWIPSPEGLRQGGGSGYTSCKGLSETIG